MNKGCFLVDLHDPTLVAAAMESSGGATTLRHFYYHNPKARKDLADEMKSTFGDVDLGASSVRVEAYAPGVSVSYLDAEAAGSCSDEGRMAALAKERLGAEASDWKLCLLQAATGEAYAGDGAAVLAGLPVAVTDRAKEVCDMVGAKADRVVHGTLASIQTFKSFADNKPVAILEMNEDDGLLIIVTAKEGVVATVPVSKGLQSIFTGIQAALELKFAGSAAKLLYDGLYDFSEIADKVVGELSEALKSAVDGLSVKPGRLVMTKTPPACAWLTRHLAGTVGAEAIEEDPWAYVGIEAGAESACHAGFLGLLKLTQEEELVQPWARDFLDVEAGMPKVAAAVGAGVAAATASSVEAPQAEAGTVASEPTSESAEPSAFTAKPSVPKKKPTLHRISPAAPSETEGADEEPAKEPEKKSAEPAKEAAVPAQEPPAQSEKQEKQEKKPAQKDSSEEKPVKAAAAPAPAKPAEKKQEKKPVDTKPAAVAAGGKSLVSAAAAKAGTAPSAAKAVQQKQSSDEDKKKKKMMIIAGGAVAAIIVLALLLLLPGGEEERANLTTSTLTTSPVASTNTTSSSTSTSANTTSAAATTPSSDVASGSTSQPVTTTPATTEAKPASPGSESGTSTTGALAATGSEAAASNQTSSTGVAVEDTVAETTPAVPEAEEVPAFLREPVSVTVATEPAGAEIFMNGQFVGESPVEINDLMDGVYQIEVQARGFKPFFTTIDVEGGKASPMPKVVLTPETGTLLVASEPSGIPFDVYEATNDTTVIASGTTPSAVPDIPVGRYVIVYKRPDWPEFIQRTRVRADEEAQSFYKFLQGRLVINTLPAGAVITTDSGRVIGQTPLSVAAWPAGAAEFQIEREGYEPESVRVVVETDRTSEISVDLLSFDRVVPADQLEVSPQVRLKIDPEVTFGLAGPERVEVVCLLDKEGIPHDPKVEFSTNDRLNPLALEAVKNWRFTPGLRKGQPVRTRVRVPFEFTPTSSDQPTLPQEEEE